MSTPITDSDVEWLKIFYSVDTDRELIAAMDRHIEKLQEKLRRLSPPQFAVWTADKPTAAGWYWIRDGDYTSVVCLSLHDDSDGIGWRLCVEIGPDDLLPLEEYEPRVQWLGPITPTDRETWRAAGRAEGLEAAVKRIEQAASEVTSE